MIAITILTLAVAGPLYTASRALVAAGIARDQMIASFLAQEGVEYIRAMRDTEYLTAYRNGGTDVSIAAWTSFLSGTNPGSITSCYGDTAVCTLDPAALGGMGTGPSYALQPCSGGACSPLYRTSGIYTQQGAITGAEETPFTRTVQVKNVVDGNGQVVPNDMQIISTVSWKFHEVPYAVTITDHLTPWQ